MRRTKALITVGAVGIASTAFARGLPPLPTSNDVTFTLPNHTFPPQPFGTLSAIHTDVVQVAANALPVIGLTIQFDYSENPPDGSFADDTNLQILSSDFLPLGAVASSGLSFGGSYGNNSPWGVRDYTWDFFPADPPGHYSHTTLFAPGTFVTTGGAWTFNWQAAYNAGVTYTNLQITVHRAAPPPCSTTCGTLVPPGNVIRQTWTLAGSPYCVSGILNVSDLTIAPGVCVQFEPGAKIVVQTTIRAVGTATQPITFASRTPTGTWDGISFNNAPEGSELGFCQFTQANGALDIVDSHPVIHDCLLSNNRKLNSNGGAIRAVLNNGDLLITNCTLRDNSSLIGGALYAETTNGSVLRLHNCQFEHNTANPASITGSYYGGGVCIANPSSRAEIIGGTFLGNRCNGKGFQTQCVGQASGGGLYGTGNITVKNVRFHNNAVFNLLCFEPCLPSVGAGMTLAGGTWSIDNCVFTCNQSICGNTSSTVFMSNVGNPSASITNCTFARNQGLAIHQAGSGVVSVRNSILFFNNQWSLVVFPQMAGVLDVAYSDIQGATVLPGVGNTNVDPGFFSSTCPCGDFSLTAASPLKDLGDPAAAYNDACFPPSLGTTRNDMGATGGPGACDLASMRPGDVTGDWCVDVDDLLAVISAWGPCPAHCAADIAPCAGRDGVVNVDDLLMVISNWGPCP